GSGNLPCHCLEENGEEDCCRVEVSGFDVRDLPGFDSRMHPTLP
ncbi:hypothetical protein A2U01_0116832, partial [Trifolium medium]|nr:hypothetical protein [Trifolium medium]